MDAAEKEHDKSNINKSMAGCYGDQLQNSIIYG
jgi:hypothetical protein